MTAAGPLLQVDGVSVRFGALLAVNRVSLDVARGEICAIIGPNGAGKTTLLNVVSGFYQPFEGRILFDGQDRTDLRPPDVAALGIARTFQNVALFKGMSVLDNIMTGRLLKMHGSVLLDALWVGPAKRQELEHRAFAERVIDFLEIQAIRKTPAGRLPYGLQKRVELARALAAEPRLLLLDEPMAGMNVEEKEDMCRFILDVNSEFGTTIALIEHDMGVVMDICDHVIVLDYGRKIADGTPEHVRKDEAVRDARRMFLLKILNTYSFFQLQVADKHGTFDPRPNGTKPIPLAQRAALDRWIVSDLQATIDRVRAGLDSYDFHAAAVALEAVPHQPHPADPIGADHLDRRHVEVEDDLARLALGRAGGPAT